MRVQLSNKTLRAKIHNPGKKPALPAREASDPLLSIDQAMVQKYLEPLRQGVSLSE